MPKSLIKSMQPDPLEKIALDSIVGCAVDYCDALSVERFSNRLRQSVALIKKHVHSHLPDGLFAEFCNKFLKKFYIIGDSRSKSRPASHHKAALEMIMDVEIIGLQCVGPILGFLDPRDAHRLRNLEVLNIGYFPNPVSTAVLENLHANYLTTFIFAKNCTNLHLNIIGPKGLMLEDLRVPFSERLTDEGLRALSRCSKLRVIDIYGCPAVSQTGINELLSVNKKIQVLAHGIQVELQDGVAVFQLDSSDQCPSMKRLIIDSSFPEDAHILSLVKKFPNLTCLRFYGDVTGDLCALKDLKLTELDFSRSRGFRWQNLRQLLTFIGPNISLLKMVDCKPRICLTQKDVDLIFTFCENIVTLGLDYLPQLATEKLVIPCFPKLEVLECYIPLEHCNSEVVLEFGEMLQLVRLSVNGFYWTLENIEAMILDNTKFPNFAVMEMCFSNVTRSYVPHVMQIAGNNNLDFVIKDLWYIQNESPLGTHIRMCSSEVER